MSKDYVRCRLSYWKSLLRRQTLNLPLEVWHLTMIQKNFAINLNLANSRMKLVTKTITENLVIIHDSCVGSLHG